MHSMSGKEEQGCFLASAKPDEDAMEWCSGWQPKMEGGSAESREKDAREWCLGWPAKIEEERCVARREGGV